MRVAHVSDCFLPRLGGIERHVDDLARRQQEAGHDVDIITSVAGRPSAGAVPVHRPAGRNGSTKIRYGQSRRGAAMLRPGRFDVLHVHVSTWSPLAFLTTRAACRYGIPVAVTVHSMWDYATGMLDVSSRILGWRDWPVAWSAVSSAAGRSLSRVLDAPVAIVPNGVDQGTWELPPRQPDPTHVVIASVMRLAARKRAPQLLEMLAQLRERVPSEIAIEAVLIGDGPQRAMLERRLRRNGLHEWVHLAGTLSRAEILRRYRAVDLYVAPAILESFGIAALEARCAGLPVVAYADTGVAEFVGHGVNGLLVDSDRAMVHALERLVMDSELRTSIATRNRADRTLVSWERVLADCEQLYSAAIDLAGGKVPSLVGAAT